MNLSFEEWTRCVAQTVVTVSCLLGRTSARLAVRSNETGTNTSIREGLGVICCGHIDHGKMYCSLFYWLFLVWWNLILEIS